MRGVLITGAAKRVGAFLAQRLAARGWHVIAHYGQSADAAAALRATITASGGQVSLLQADLADPAAPDAMIEASFSLCPEVEAIVNNASLFKYDTPETARSDDLREAFAVNAAAPVLLAQAFARRLPEGRSGCIVNMLDNRVFGLNPDYFSYGVAKYALHGATQMMAMALPRRIRVAGVAPGVTLPSGAQTDADFERARMLNPLGGGGTPEQLLQAVEFILATSSFHGQVLTIDGGESLAPHARDVAFLDPD